MSEVRLLRMGARIRKSLKAERQAETWSVSNAAIIWIAQYGYLSSKRRQKFSRQAISKGKLVTVYCIQAETETVIKSIHVTTSKKALKEYKGKLKP